MQFFFGLELVSLENQQNFKFKNLIVGYNLDLD